MPETIVPFPPGTYVRFRYSLTPTTLGVWVVQRVCSDGSLLLRQGGKPNYETRVCDPREVVRV